ncbi:MAG: oligosaccharide flippase family protein, partial [archaeon]|nr:oligosaccharide flippase family protein [archaeon]
MLKINKALLGGSLILLITFNIFNALNFVFQFSMARMLSVIDYGILATLFSIIYISGIFSESIQTIMMKYSSSEKDEGKIKNLMNRSIKKALKISILLLAVYLIIAIFLTDILKISYPLLALDGIIILSSLFIPINRGIMLGKKMFKSLGANLILESFGKLIISIVLVFMGWRVYGAIIATILAATLAFIFSFKSL